jgi:hypothetical protein
VAQDLKKLVQGHSTVDLTEHRNLALLLVQAQEAEKYWKDKVARCKDELRSLASDAEVLLVNGEPVFTNMPIDRLNVTAFKAEEPDLYEVYQHEVTKTELDEDLLKRARPDIWERFAVRQFRQVK